MFGFCNKLGGLDLFGFIWIYLDLFGFICFAFVCVFPVHPTQYQHIVHISTNTFGIYFNTIFLTKVIVVSIFD